MSFPSRRPDQRLSGSTCAPSSTGPPAVNPPQGMICLPCILPRSRSQFAPHLFQPNPAEPLRALPRDLPFLVQLLREPPAAVALHNLRRLGAMRPHCRLEP